MINIRSDTAVLNGGSFYRLKQTLQSPGDIFEIDSSAAAVYVGPDSDLTEYRLTYYDEQQPNELQTADISVNGPFVGQLASLLDTTITATGQKARILANAIDLYQPGFIRVFPTIGNAARTVMVPPQVDLIWSFTPDIPDVPNVRADRTFRFTRVPFDDETTAGGTDILIPAYGRRSITVQVQQAALGAQTFIDFYKIIFRPGLTASQSPQQVDVQSAGLKVGGVSIPTQQTYVLRASNDFSLETNSAAVLNYRDPIRGVIGVFDYLCISIYGGPLEVAGGTLDSLFVKLSDREV
jgi:hypothetical protein